MIKANALFIVVVIALVIGILSSSLIIIAYYQRLQVQRDLLIKKLDTNAYSAINILLSGSDNIPFGEEKEMDLYGDETDSVSIKKISWGLFEVAAVKARLRNLEQKKSVMYGYKPDEKGRSAIYLVDQNSPLSLGGSSSIHGNCYLPQAGIKRAYIEGQPFSGKNLINGEIKKSDFQLPSVNKDLAKQISYFIDSPKSNTTDNFEVFTGEIKDTMVRSFMDKTLLLYFPENFSLARKSYQGNIVICSDKNIDIDSSSRLSDVLIFAPSVTVSDYFKGTVQFFCKDSIIIGKGCHFLYPSALGLFKKEASTIQPKIIMGEEGVFKGIVFSFEILEDLQKTFMSIGKNTEVEGQIYSQGFVDFKGIIYGNISCSKFALRTPSSVYENHLLNVTIDAEKLSPFFVGSSMISSSNKKGIIKWLE